jgi:tRNA-Thr(GGU) m(6)t(6)A37 methyltransferase TsaA
MARKDYVESVPFPDQIALRPIGVVRSPYRQRYGTPRQATVTQGTLGDAEQDARIELDESVVPAAALGGLEGFGRLWVVSWFHLNQGWNPTVVPPRGPKVRRGVLATRAPHRPNQLGLSAVRVVRVEGHVVHVRGIDLLDGTPVLDLKPYVPYADAFPDAAAGWLDTLDQPMDAPDRPTRGRR